MKTLTDIIERNDYKRLTPSLKERTEEVAEIIRKKMRQLSLDKIDLDEDKVSLRIKTFKANCGSSYTCLMLVRSVEYYTVVTDDHEEKYENLVSLEDIGCEYYYQRDYNCYIIGANYREALNFLNKANSIMQHLDKIETAQTDEVNKVLADTEWIVKAS